MDAGIASEDNDIGKSQSVVPKLKFAGQQLFDISRLFI